MAGIRWVKKMNDITLVQLLAALPLLCFGAVGLGGLIWFLRRIGSDKGNNLF